MRRKNHNVTRNRQEKTVVLRIQRQGKMYHQAFALSKYEGSWTQAEAAARERRDELLPNMPKRDSGRGRMTRRNSSGVVGVSLGLRTVTQADGSLRTYTRWIAKWPDCPKRGGMPWSVMAYGEDDAFVLAALSREMESIDAKKILAELERIKDKKKYQEILSKRKSKANTIAKRKTKTATK